MTLRIPAWLLLTMIMAFMVLVAAFVFLLQGRMELEQQRTLLRQELTAGNSQINTLELELTVAAGTLADYAATRTAESARPTASPVPSPTALPLSAEIAFFAPRPDTIAAPDRPVDLLLVVSHPAGIGEITLSVNGESWQTYTADGDTLYTVQTQWQSAAEGEYIFEAAARSAGGAEIIATAATRFSVVDVAGRLNSLVRKIQANTEEVRGLTAQVPITLTLLTPAELRTRLDAAFFGEMDEEQARKDVIAWHAFDFLPLDFDLYTALRDLYSDSLLGFYDLKTAEMVVVSKSANLSPYQQLVLVHEIVHALQAQNFEFEWNSDDSEANAALRALAEGDATLTQMRYLEGNYFSNRELSELMRQMAGESADYPDLPSVLINAQLFPYTAGYEFVLALDAEGGFDAINAAWANPPVSTEQILHPDRYLSGDLPIPVTLPPLTSTLGSGWELVDEGVFGEFYLREYLAQQLDTRTTDRAATGWGGDRYAVYWNEAAAELVLVLRTVWDTPTDAAEFNQAFGRYAAARYPDPVGPVSGTPLCRAADDVICLYPPDGESREVLIIRAPATPVVTAIAQTIRPNP
jgi:hypothetical protein